MEQLGSHLTDFHEILYLSIFPKLVEKNSSSNKTEQEWRHCMTTAGHFWSYYAYFFLEWAMCQTEVVKEIKTHFVFGNFLFLK